VILSDDMKEGFYKEKNITYHGYYLDRSLNEEQPPGATDPAASVAGMKSENAPRLVNHEPLLVNTVNSWSARPDAYLPGLDNLFLASDYVRTATDLATMEGANEAARRAVNAILNVSGIDAAPCKVWRLHEPMFFEPFKWYDAWRYRIGMPYRNTPGWFDVLMIGWGVIYGAGLLLYTAWTLITNELTNLNRKKA
jgi:hypothetical protein